MLGLSHSWPSTRPPAPPVARDGHETHFDQWGLEKGLLGAKGECFDSGKRRKLQKEEALGLISLDTHVC